MIDADTEIRKLRPAELYALAQTLSIDSWKILMCIIPTSNNDSTPAFTSEHVRMIECAAKKHHRNPAEVFLDEWGTWGCNRPTVKSMIDVCIKHELFRTADFLAVQILKQDPPKRPHLGPAALVKIPEDFINHFNMNDNESEPDNINAAFCHQTTAEANDTKFVTEMSCSFDKLLKLQQFNATTKTDNVEKSSSIHPYRSGDLLYSEQIDAAVLAKNDVGVIEVNYSELPEKYAKDYGIYDRNFDHPKFSYIMKMNSTYNKEGDSELVVGKSINNRSNVNSNDNANNNDKVSENLMKFSTITKKMQYGLEQSSSVLPNLEMLKLKRSIEDMQKNSGPSQTPVSVLPNLDKSKLKNLIKQLPKNDEITFVPASNSFLPNLEDSKLSNSLTKLPYNLPEELQSSELPLCIKSVIGKNSKLENWSPLRTKVDSQSNETIRDSSLNNSDIKVTIDCNDNLISRELPQVLLEYNKNKISRDEKTFHIEENANPVNNSQELPLTVLEFSKR